MIGKVCRRGTDTRRLLGYLFTEGLAGERGLDSAHVDARVIAGYQPPGGLEPQRRADGRADVTRLAALLDAPVRAGGVGKAGRATYHLAISAAPTDRLLSDAEWADIAESYLDRLGLAERGDDSAVRWVAVRHADNHVHVVATLVRQDGRRVFPHHDFYRAREASLEVERRYGLTPTSPVDRTSNPETTRAEQRKHKGAVRAAAQAGMSPPAGPDREVLRARVRAALAGSDGWEQFADRLRLSGVLVRERYSTRNPGELTGYAVSLPTRGPDRGGQPVWFGGGRLAPDLSRIGDRPLSAVRRSDIQALITSSGQRLAPKTVENHFRLIKAIFSAAVEDQLIAVSPCRKIARQPVAASRVVPLSVDQVERLIAATPQHFRALIVTAVGTGLRQGEALGLRGQDVDFLRREVHVRHQLVSVPGVTAHLGPPTTASSLRTVPAPAFVLEALSEHVRLFAPGPFEMIFSNTRGSAVNRQSLHRSLAAALRAAGLPAGITFHQLRHTYASLLIDGGESVTVVADRMGHKNATETLQTYSHLWPSSDDKTRQVLDKAFATVQLLPAGSAQR